VHGRRKSPAELTGEQREGRPLKRTEPSLQGAAQPEQQVRRKIGGVSEPAVVFAPLGYKDFGDVPSGDLAAWLRASLAA